MPVVNGTPERLEDPLNRRHHRRIGLNEPGQGQIVVGGALVADRRRHDDRVAQGEGGIQRPGASASDKDPAAIVDRFLQEQRRQWRADAGLEEGDALAAMAELEDRVDAVLGMQAGHLPGPPLGRDLTDDVAEKAHDRADGTSTSRRDGAHR